jgi:hypothetical protein
MPFWESPGTVFPLVNDFLAASILPPHAAPGTG